MNRSVLTFFLKNKFGSSDALSEAGGFKWSTSLHPSWVVASEFKIWNAGAISELSMWLSRLLYMTSHSLHSLFIMVNTNNSAVSGGVLILLRTAVILHSMWPCDVIERLRKKAAKWALSCSFFFFVKLKMRIIFQACLCCNEYIG